MAMQGFALEFEGLIPDVVEAGLPNCLCTIQQRTNTVSVTGQPDFSDWVDIAEFVEIDAMASIDRPSIPNMSATVRQPQQFDTETLIHVLLMGFYPGILQQNQCVLVGGPYSGSSEIIAVESDSQETQTRLAIRAWTI